jgi:hypothetical protein
MTEDKLDLQALLGKSADPDFLREMIGFAAERLMALEVGALTGAGYGYSAVENGAEADDESAREMLRDWGWAPTDPRPQWW